MSRRKTTLKQAVAFMRLMNAMRDDTEMATAAGDDDLYKVHPGPSTSRSSGLSTALGGRSLVVSQDSSATV